MDKLDFAVQFEEIGVTQAATELSVLDELQLVLVGGGIGDVCPH